MSDPLAYTQTHNKVKFFKNGDVDALTDSINDYFNDLVADADHVWTATIVANYWDGTQYVVCIQQSYQTAYPDPA